MHKLTLAFVDENGEISKMTSNIQIDAQNDTLGDIAAEVEDFWDVLYPCTAGGLQSASVSLHLPINPTSYAGGTAYGDAADRAALMFRSATSKVTIGIPIPNAGIFMAGDSKRVDPTDAAIAAIIVQILALLADTAGNALIAYVRGWRKRAKRK